MSHSPAGRASRTIALIACGKRKQTHVAPARQLYTGQLFRKSLAYAGARHVDAVYILSAKHGLVGLDQLLRPYDMSLYDLTPEARRLWADRVLARLQANADLDSDCFLVLAGKAYREHLVRRLKRVETPLEGLGIGEQLRFLTNFVQKEIVR